ncbi:PACE efflux transporter [Faucicola boevrei]|uniref:PACE efflux transporter n=1 Tax=Faucicola boevrei TaxID=346665 RepID=UPI00036179DB|nr:PACE efflux transporter [Moraxella boevrei]
MNIKERIFQAILFETLAIMLSWGLVKILTFFGFGKQQTSENSHVLLMLIGISLIAMIWTFVYNIVFDKIFTGEKLARPVWVRVVHIVGFEGGLLCFTLPLVMWVMSIGLWQAFLLDISLTVLILVYGFIFYWVYDNVRAKWVKS